MQAAKGHETEDERECKLRGANWQWVLKQKGIK